MKRKRSLLKRPRKSVSSLEVLWDVVKNGRSFIHGLKHSSRKKYHWTHIGECGCKHEWYNSVDNMTRPGTGVGCRICSRSQMSEPCCEVGTIITDKELMKSYDFAKNKHLNPAKIYLGSSQLVNWICTDTCEGQLDCKHEWVTQAWNKWGCPYHRAMDIKPCCQSKSMANPIYKEIVAQWDIIKMGEVTARCLHPGSIRRVHWICKKAECGCDHSWNTTLCARIIPGKSEPKSNCPFCSHHRICCRNHPRSLMQWNDKEKLSCIIIGLPNTFDDLAKIHLGSEKVIWARCKKCEHNFDFCVIDATQKDKPCWCPYCGSKRLCSDENCKFCFLKSLASWSNKEKLQSYENGGNLLKPRAIFLHSSRRCNFKCAKCEHIFRGRVDSMTSSNPGWCPYCGKHAVCGNLQCKTCKLKCETLECRAAATTKTRLERIWYCQDCYTNYLKLHPKERKNSKGEEECYEILEDMGITFIQQFKLESLGKKKFDFYFRFQEQNYLLEYDGGSHFNFTQYFHKTDQNFLVQRKVDVLKTKTAIAEDYFIIRIDHKCFECIQDHILNALSKFDGIIENVFVSKNCYFSNVNMYKYIIDEISI